MKFRKAAVILKFVKYPLLLAGVLVASLLIATNIFLSDMRTVQIQYNGEVKTVITTGRTVKDALAVADIALKDGEVMNCSEADSLDDVANIIIQAPREITVTIRGEEYQFTTYQDTVSEVLAENGIEVQGTDIIEGADLNETISEGMSIEIKTYREVFYDETEIIGHETKYVANNDMLKGQYKTAVAGYDGYRTKYYRVLLENEKEIECEVLKEDYKAPQDTVIHYGTIMNFKNVIGQTVAYTKKYTLLSTAYSPTPGNWGYQTYTGNTNREGGVAVDPTHIPLGTKLYVKGLNGKPDYGFAIAWDVGKSIKGDRIDLFMESEETCIIWGMRDVEVYILADQSVDIFALRKGALFVGQ